MGPTVRPGLDLGLVGLTEHQSGDRVVVGGCIHPLGQGCGHPVAKLGTGWHFHLPCTFVWLTILERLLSVLAFAPGPSLLVAILGVCCPSSGCSGHFEGRYQGGHFVQ